jgi:ABC-type lipoprotein export system ATPase subunit
MDHGIECRKIDAAYRQSDGSERFVLKGIDGWFPADRMTLISGVIGAGKSTLLHILAGLQRPTAGEVIVNGKAVSRWIGAHRDLWRRQVGIVFQLHHLINDLTVFENVILPLIPIGVSLSECRGRVVETLQALELNHLAESLISTLSGGERQKVAVARAMVNRPAFILADEPTAHQDAKNAEQVLRMLESALDWGAVVVIASHDTEIQRFTPEEDHYVLKDGILKGIE